MSRHLRYILIALGLTIFLTASGLALLLSPSEKPAPSIANRSASILVAARFISAGSRITSADIAWQEVPNSALPSTALERSRNAEAQVVGAVALRNLAPGEMLTEKLFARMPDAATLATSLNPGWRAVTITATAAQTLAGMLLPNDRVDLLISSGGGAGPQVSLSLPFSQSNGAALGTTTAIITNVRVIAINGSTKAEESEDMSKSGAESGGTLTLEVLPDQVSTVLSAATSGQIAISLRSRLDSNGPPAQLVIPPPPPVRPAPPAAPGPGEASTAANPPRPASNVTIIRGGAGQRAE